MTTAFEVVAEPNRRRILDLLRAGERPVAEIVTGLEVSQPAVSKHLRVLRDAGMVEVRIDAQRRLYRLRPHTLREVDDWLTPYRALWIASLDKLEHHLDHMEHGTSRPERPRGKGGPRRGRHPRTRR